jgi:putative transposase
MRAGLAIDAITAAHRTGLVAGNAIMHADRGSQYHAKAYRNALRRLEIRRSTSRTGSCLDGAAAESFFATIKTEIGAESWPDRASARRDIENWITACNERRLHSSLGYKTPIEVRTAWQERISTAALNTVFRYGASGPSGPRPLSSAHRVWLKASAHRSSAVAASRDQVRA